MTSFSSGCKISNVRVTHHLITLDVLIWQWVGTNFYALGKTPGVNRIVSFKLTEGRLPALSFRVLAHH